MPGNPKQDPPQTDVAPCAANSPYQPLALDIAKYRSMLDHYDLSEAQKDDYINALWLLVVSFADLNLPHLFEGTKDSCGQAAKDARLIPDKRRTVLNSFASQPAQDFAAVANCATPPKPEQKVS